MNSTLEVVEIWFIPVDILSIVCNVLAIALATLFLLVIIFDKTCHTIPVMLAANSSLSELILGIIMLWITIFTLHNDLKQIQYEDSLCAFRGYLTYTACALQNYSYLIQAVYRYVIVVYPACLFWQTVRTQILFISLMWIIAFVFPIPFLCTGEIVYNIDNQICQLPLRFSVSMNIATVCVYLFPVPMLIFIYFKLVLYVRKMNQRVTPVNILLRARRELKMVRRTVIIAMIIVIIGLPYASFIFISFFTSPPKYHFRIAYIFVSIPIVCVMIALFQFTDAVNTSMRKILTNRIGNINSDTNNSNLR